MSIRGMLIVDGSVENVAVFNSEDDLFDGWVSAQDNVGPGYTDNGDGTFSPSEVVQE